MFIELTLMRSDDQGTEPLAINKNAITAVRGTGKGTIIVVRGADAEVSFIGDDGQVTYQVTESFSEVMAKLRETQGVVIDGGSVISP